MFKLLVALAGPALNICLALAIAFMPEFREKTTCIYTNLLIGIFNLIPIYPLDGGRALEAILKSFFNTYISEELIHRVSNISLIIVSLLGILGLLYLKNIAIAAIIIYLWTIVILENKKYRIKKRVYKILKREAI